MLKSTDVLAASEQWGCCPGVSSSQRLRSYRGSQGCLQGPATHISSNPSMLCENNLKLTPERVTEPFGYSHCIKIPTDVYCELPTTFRSSSPHLQSGSLHALGCTLILLGHPLAKPSRSGEKNALFVTSERNCAHQPWVPGRISCPQLLLASHCDHYSGLLKGSRERFS